MTWRKWAEEKPADGELFIGRWDYGSTYICRFVDPPGQAYPHDGPIGTGPFSQPPDRWLRLPEADEVYRPQGGEEA